MGREEKVKASPLVAGEKETNLENRGGGGGGERKLSPTTLKTVSCCHPPRHLDSFRLLREAEVFSAALSLRYGVKTYFSILFYLFFIFLPLSVIKQRSTDRAQN